MLQITLALCCCSQLIFWYGFDIQFQTVALIHPQMQFFAEPFHRLFFLDNINIQYPHAEHERVPLAWLFIYAGGVPLAFILSWAMIVRPPVHKAHVSLLGLFISLILTSFTTDVIKDAVGRPRPDLLSRCKPEKGTPAHILVSYTVCTETNPHVLHDGWRSFPSGHSSFAFAGLGFLTLFLSGQTHALRPRTDLARSLLALAPLLGAALIAISRCEDYRHDVYDVTCGSALGFAVAWFCYRRYFPPLRSAKCHVPYPPPGADLAKVKDEEARIAVAGEYGIADEEGESEGEEGELRPLTSSSRPS